jgi:hypothetical protein
MAKPDHVVRYLGQYTHRVAITNPRILNIGEKKVTFIAKDYRDKAQNKPVSMCGVEFLRRFLHACAPKAFCEDTPLRHLSSHHHTQPWFAICAQRKAGHRTVALPHR